MQREVIFTKMLTCVCCFLWFGGQVFKGLESLPLVQFPSLPPQSYHLLLAAFPTEMESVWCHPQEENFHTHSVSSKMSEHQICNPSLLGSWGVGDRQNKVFMCRVPIVHLRRKDSDEICTVQRNTWCNTIANHMHWVPNFVLSDLFWVLGIH